MYASVCADVFNPWKLVTEDSTDFVYKAKLYVENSSVGVIEHGELTNYINEL